MLSHTENKQVTGKSFTPKQGVPRHLQNRANALPHRLRTGCPEEENVKALSLLTENQHTLF
jgi:hypothetical protein